MKKPAMGIIEKTLMAVMLCMAPFVFASPAYADDVDLTVTVTISQILCLEYVPRPTYTDEVDFDITLDDIIHGSVAITNHGDIYWWSNTAPWKITVERSEWTVLSGSPDFGWYLEVKYGPPDNSKWIKVETWEKDFCPSTEFVNPIGTGIIEGVDWKIKELLWKWSPPGSYECTVTFTMVVSP